MTTDPAGASLDASALRRRVADFVAEHDPATTDQHTFLAARFDAGLAWVHFPEGEGGLGAPRALQPVVDEEFERLGFTPVGREGLVIGLGMAAPTILAFGTPEQRARYLKPLYTGEEIWCQLFSEPGAGSDLAALGTRAVREGDVWTVSGQKVWTSLAHRAQFAILVARTDPDVPKHKGITYFICDMNAEGVDVRALRQITGEAEFNEVYLDDVAIPDSQRVGGEGEGWRVAQTTLMNERVSIGGHPEPREGGLISVAAHLWRERPDVRTPGLHDQLMRLWVAAEAARLTKERLRQQLAIGQPGPEGSAAKYSFSRLNQEISGLELEMLGGEGLTYDDWTFRRPEGVEFSKRAPGFHYLRSKGNSIEGGTTEILRNIIAERVLGLPPEPRTDKDVAFKDLPK
ncbi:acyl-CoA dehydrogenase family protein [Streptomonospora salina]|uniref:Alkylation response protein AidB-like acyl-CoA dehydrogenase n=1 Tax=Streptomonospora salina TaxID=104205 RepID=A0A841E893_9ACTN|nr:acyl-CoA dehydrogenase family protein [Streptomonospora salina]MBB5997338.1 alkylation response protein AidB-like acyl-CoA dehydrogenase [Streptomonospora salina]